jgi:hypothetical protein
MLPIWIIKSLNVTSGSSPPGLPIPRAVGSGGAHGHAARGLLLRLGLSSRAG